MNLKQLRAALGAKQPGETQQSATAPAPAAETAGAAIELSAEQETALTAALAEAKAEGVKEGTKAANDRFAAILGSDKVKGNLAAALSIATKAPEMSAESVIDIAAGLPAGANTATIADRMKGQGADLSLGAPMQQAKGGDAAAGWDKAIARLPGAKRA